MFNLCTIKNRGIDAFISSSEESKTLYDKGLMEVGKSPKLR